jgi:hypothetical protein
MAINPESERKTAAVIEHEKWTSAEKKHHLVSRKRLIMPWQEWAKENRLDSYWTRFPLKGRRAGPPPFQVEEKAVPSGDGKVEVEWTVWEASERLHDKEVEFYSVMRAEKHFINAGYRKLASKYAFSRFGLTVEDCGVDNFFFRASDKRYVFCESKFTRDPGTLASWKADKKRVWARLSNYKGQRQMSWEWIRDRANRAASRPSGIANETPRAEKQAILRGVTLMRWAADRKEGRRVVNIHGAAHVPVCPGVYSFTSDEAGVSSSNELVVDWPFTPGGDEFIELDHEFDAWADKESAGSTTPPAEGNGT